MWRRDKSDTRPALQRRADKRMRTISTLEVLTWADSAGSAAAKALDDYRRDPSSEALTDARGSLESVLGCLDALEARLT